MVQIHAVILIAIPSVEEVLTIFGVAVAAPDDVLVIFEFKQTLNDCLTTITASEAETLSSYVMCAA